jgi:hypothetical protein
MIARRGWTTRLHSDLGGQTLENKTEALRLAESMPTSAALRDCAATMPPLETTAGMPAAALPGLDAALVQRMLDDAGRSALGADLGLIERLRSDLGGIRHWLRNVLLKPNLPFCLPLIPLSRVGHGPAMASVLPDAG